MIPITCGTVPLWPSWYLLLMNYSCLVSQWMKSILGIKSRHAYNGLIHVMVTKRHFPFKVSMPDLQAPA